MPRRKKILNILYLGLELPTHPENEHWVHHPLIKVLPRSGESCSYEIFHTHSQNYTHIIFTSKTAVKLLSKHLNPENVDAAILAVGASTAEEAIKLGWPTPLSPRNETAEGLVDLLNTLDLTNAFVLWPHSALSRPILYDYFQEKGISLHHPVLYDTITKTPDVLLDLQQFDAVFFTSPSTVDAFFEVYGRPPSHLELRSIGTVTETYLQSRLAKF